MCMCWREPEEDVRCKGIRWIMWVLGTEPMASARTVSALNHLGVSLVPEVFLSPLFRCCVQ